MILPFLHKKPTQFSKDFHSLLQEDGWEIRISTAGAKKGLHPIASVFIGEETQLEVTYQDDLAMVSLCIREPQRKKACSIHFVLENKPWALLDWLKTVKDKLYIDAIPMLLMQSGTRNVQILRGHDEPTRLRSSNDPLPPLYVKGW